MSYFVNDKIKWIYSDKRHLWIAYSWLSNKIAITRFLTRREDMSNLANQLFKTISNYKTNWLKKTAVKLGVKAAGKCRRVWQIFSNSFPCFPLQNLQLQQRHLFVFKYIVNEMVFNVFYYKRLPPIHVAKIVFVFLKQK